MAELTIYRLTFRSGFHLGVHGVNLEEGATHIPSDTLFAALVEAHLRTGGDGERFVRPFQDGRPPFLLTSAFPFAGTVRFFPMPVPLERWFGLETLRRRLKALRSIRFVSEGLLRQMLAGKRMDGWLFAEGPESASGVALQGGLFWLSAEEVNRLPGAFWKHPRTARPIPSHALRTHPVFLPTQVPRVTLDRVTSASNIFHVGRVSFAPHCGFWFGIRWLHPDETVEGGLSFRDAVHRALAILADDGLGGERSVGYGSFSWAPEQTPLPLPEPTEGNQMYLLSRYHPRADPELPDALARSLGYTLTAVAGWLRPRQGAAQRRQRLWLVAEGSLIRAVGPGPWGDLTDVRPRYMNPEGDVPHPVWRYGLALGTAVEV